MATSEFMIGEFVKLPTHDKKTSVTVCEDCGRNWTATLREVPVISIINDLDEYYKSLRNKVINDVEVPKVLYIFHPSDGDICNTSSSLSVVVPRQESPYHWHINHKHEFSMSVSGCRIIPCTGNYDGCNNENVPIGGDIVKQEIDPLDYHNSHNEDIKPDISQITLSSVTNTSGAAVAGPGGKKFILVKTSKGLTPMSKVKLVQSKAGGGVGGAGATIVKLVTTQAGGTRGKPIMTTATTPGGQILTLPAGATTAQAENMVQQGQHNIVIAKQQNSSISNPVNSSLPSSSLSDSSIPAPVKPSISKPNPARKRPSEDAEKDFTEPLAGSSGRIFTPVRKANHSPERLPLKIAKRTFDHVSDGEMSKLREERHEESTKKNTTWGVKLFKEWLKERQDTDGLPVSVDFEEYSKELMDDLLSAFYPSIRTAQGKWFTKSSYICFRAAIQRHLSSAPWNVPYFIVTDPAFKNSNEVLEGIFEKLSRESKDNAKPRLPIEEEDFNKLKTSGTIGTHSPLALIRLVWLNIALHFNWRGRKNCRVMTKDTFCIGVDGDGHQFIEHTTEENDKLEDRIYEVEGDEYCPVKAFTLYISHLHPDLDCLWQKPNPHFRAGNWYLKNPIGHNTLGKMMPSMSKDAHLSNIYTNHCIKKTVQLNEQGIKGPKENRASSKSANMPIIECDDLQEVNDNEILDLVGNY